MLGSSPAGQGYASILFICSPIVKVKAQQQDSGLTALSGFSHGLLRLSRAGGEMGFHGLQQGMVTAHGHLPCSRPPTRWLMIEEGNSIKHIQRGQGIDAVSQAGVLHQQGGPTTTHPGSGADPHTLLLSGSGQMNDIRIEVNQPQQLLEVYAGHRCHEIDTGTPQAPINGEAWIHIQYHSPARPLNLCRDQLEVWSSDKDDSAQSNSDAPGSLIAFTFDEYL